jgi:hypothetical protein
MDVLVLALYAEGPSDAHFLPPIIQRTSEAILARFALTMVGMSDPLIITKKHGNLDWCILQASQEAKHCHVLLVHNDADRLEYDEARRQRFEPGLHLVQQSGDEVCHHLVPVIPVRMIEAWMLADGNALRNVLGTNLDHQMLDLPRRAALVETIADPKYRLNDIIRKINAVAGSRRRQPINLNAKLEPLARQIDLNKLFEVPSYRTFVNDLAQTLEHLHFIPYDSTQKIFANNHFSRY